MRHHSRIRALIRNQKKYFQAKNDNSNTRNNLKNIIYDVKIKQKDTSKEMIN